MASTENSPKKLGFQCSCCKIFLWKPFARCATCPGPVLLCYSCLSQDAQFAEHLPSHSFVMLRLDFPLFEENWTAEESMKLVNALKCYGPSNWDAVAECLGSKHSAKECEKHYYKHFYQTQKVKVNPAYVAHRASSHNPPRFPSTSVLYNAFSGYNAARGEFKVEYDNEAERLISDLDINTLYSEIEGWDEEDMKVHEKMFYGLIDAYRRRLHERERRKQIIAEHGLIQPQKNFVWMRRFDNSSMQLGIRGGERPVASSDLSLQLAKVLAKFAQFLSAKDLDSMFESLKRESDLKLQLNNLYELRRNGITSSEESSLNKILTQRREENSRSYRKYLTNPILSWRNAQEGKTGKFPHVVTQTRRVAPPLNISRLPGHEKLTNKEREFCSNARIVPESFVEFRNLLIAECMKQGGLRLAQARLLIKIDVNKTRKLYDFLLEEGSINQP